MIVQFRTFVGLIMAAALAVWPTVAAELPATGPQLEASPVARPAAGEALPPAATWPVLRYETPPRLLAILGKNESAAAYQRIAQRLRASLELRYVGFGDGRYHVNDKWIEPQGDPTAAELDAAALQLARDAVWPAGGGTGNLPFDIVLTGNPNNLLSDREMQQRLRAFVEAGGVLAVCTSVYPAADSPLGSVWPAKATSHNSWMGGGAVNAGGPELAGVPVERLAGHAWIPIVEVAAGARALATGETGAAFVRDVGKGHLLFVPMGPISRKWDAVAAFGRTYDPELTTPRLTDKPASAT